MTNFVLDLAQSSDGAISGSWAGSGVETNGTCPPQFGCAPSAGVVGSNLVFQVHIDLLGAGAFTGQVQGEQTFRGHLAGAAMTFRRAAPGEGTRFPEGVP